MGHDTIEASQSVKELEQELLGLVDFLCSHFESDMVRLVTFAFSLPE
jgi:hypothetical protein